MLMRKNSRRCINVQSSYTGIRQNAKQRTCLFHRQSHNGARGSAFCSVENFPWVALSSRLFAQAAPMTRDTCGLCRQRAGGAGAEEEAGQGAYAGGLGRGGRRGRRSGGLGGQVARARGAEEAGGQAPGGAHRATAGRPGAFVPPACMVALIVAIVSNASCRAGDATNPSVSDRWEMHQEGHSSAV